MRSLGDCKLSKPLQECFELHKILDVPASPLFASDGQPILLQEVLFEPNTYICDSRHNNLIAFQLEVGLLRRVLQAAGANDADSLEVSSSLCSSVQTRWKM